MNRGLLIVLEGIDGSGKTTLARGIAAAIRTAGGEVVETREPTDGPFGRRIREIAASRRDEVTAEEELELFMKDRAEHVASVVRPALERGAVVVQDRSFYSTVAYQGERGLDRDRLLRLGREVAPEPDVLLVVDVAAETASARIEASRGARDDFEGVESLARIRQVFLGFEGIRVVDANRGPEETLEQALDHVRAVAPDHLPA